MVKVSVCLTSVLHRGAGGCGSRHEMVRLLLSHGAEVNCYFRVVNDTSFPTALQYCLKDAAMLRLLLNHGYHAHK